MHAGGGRGNGEAGRDGEALPRVRWVRPEPSCGLARQGSREESEPSCGGSWSRDQRCPPGDSTLPRCFPFSSCRKCRQRPFSSRGQCGSWGSCQPCILPRPRRVTEGTGSSGLDLQQDFPFCPGLPHSVSDVSWRKPLYTNGKCFSVQRELTVPYTVVHAR